jgi:hypothetical protein
LNPEVPNVVLAGFGPEIERAADIFARQPEPVPVFVKHRVNYWEYVGTYRVTRLSRNAEEIAAKATTAGRKGEVSLILFLEQAGMAAPERSMYPTAQEPDAG